MESDLGSQEKYAGNLEPEMGKKADGGAILCLLNRQNLSIHLCIVNSFSM